MSIIIKGLDLPPISDTNGFINLSIDCYGQVVVHNTYPTKILKAEQLPKHGRLIEESKVLDIVSEWCPDDDGSIGKDGNLREMLDEIEALPAIIPAEEE